MDQESGSGESSNDDEDPEESDETSGGGDVDYAVDSGGFQKLFDTTFHSEGLWGSEGLLRTNPGFDLIRFVLNTKLK